MRLLSCIVLLLVAAGCASGPKDPGVPEGADMLTELVSPAGEKSDRFTSLEVPEAGALYVFDATANQMLYSGALEAGDIVKLSWGGVIVAGRMPTKSSYKPAYERQVARYATGRMYRVYYKPGEAPKAPTTNEGSPLTRPFQVRERTVNPLDPKPK